MKALLIVGTRPEAIKMAPIRAALKASEYFEPVWLATGQHLELLAQAQTFFGIHVDHDLRLMTPNQSLCGVTSKAITGIDAIIQTEQPNIIIVQGDTTSAFAGAYAGFLNRIPVAHVEAGLRTWNLREPFPEEANRRLISNLCTLHFCPTEKAQANLLAEGINEGLHVVGNTVIDALLQAIPKVQSPWQPTCSDLRDMDGDSQCVLITLHRRESFQGPIDDILDSIGELASKHAETSFVFPVHPNPNIQSRVYGRLGMLQNVHLIAPLDYPDFIWLMARSRLILTDSGGVQEEAPTLGIPVLVLRNTTERPEGVDAGACLLVGTSKIDIINHANNLLSGAPFKPIANPYGDGNSADRIVAVCHEYLSSAT